MVDVAALGLRVDSSQVEKGTLELQKLTGAARGAETASKGLAGGTRTASAAAQGMASAADREAAALAVSTSALRVNTAAHQVNGAAMRMANMQRTNLIFQLNDIGVSLASGMNPLMVAIQQGSQISAIYGPGEGGIGKALGETAKLAGSAVTKFWPLAAAVGAVTLGFAAMTTEINRTADTQVSMTDVMLASWELLAEGIMNALDPVFDFFGGLWNAISPHIANAANGIIGMFDLAFKDVSTIWSMLPAALGDSTIQTLNTMMTAIEDFLNQNRMKIAAFMLQVSPALGPFGGQMAAAGGRLAAAPVTFDRLENPLAGAESAFNQQMAQNRLDVMTTDYIGLIGQRAQEIANRPDKDALEKAAKEAERQAEAYQDLVRSAEQRIAQSQLEVQTLGMTTEATNALRYSQELLNKAANENIDLTPQQTQNLSALGAAMAAAEASAKRTVEAFNWAKDTTKGFFSDLLGGLREGKSLWESFGSAASNVLDKIANKLLDLAIDNIFGGIAQGGGAGIFGFLGSLLGFANGGVFSAGHQIHAFAQGGIVNRPTLFPMANGAGLMAEAGPEAIMPLRRGPNGKLGVISHANQNIGGRIHISLGWEQDGSGNIAPVIKKVANDTAVEVVAQATPGIVGASVSRSNQSAPAALARYQHQVAGGDYRD